MCLPANRKNIASCRGKIMGCPLCDDITKHNVFVQMHRNGTPRANTAGKALGVSTDEVLKHRRHQGAFVAIIPIPISDKPIEENVQSSDADPMRSLQELKSTLTGLLTQIRFSKNLNPGDVVRVVSEIRSLITTSEDLQIKLAAAKGSENSAFTQSELKEIFLILKGLCPDCRGKLCGTLKENY